MKIENNGSSELSRPEFMRPKPVEGSQTSGSSAVDRRENSRDQLALSERALLLSKAQGALAQVPDVRADKVQTARQALDDGTYAISYEKLARRLATRL